jgi:quinol monooxygenase YgiN
MYARVTTVQIAPGNVDEATNITREAVIPAAQQAKGFKGYWALGDRATGKSVVITLWETEADRDASGPGSAYYQEVMAKIAPLFTAPPIVENLEVIIQV